MSYWHSLVTSNVIIIGIACLHGARFVLSHADLPVSMSIMPYLLYKTYYVVLYCIEAYIILYYIILYYIILYVLA